MHPRVSTYHRVVRSLNHNTLPNFIGSYFPRSDDAQQAELYAASMLMLLKPWRWVMEDLKGDHEKWTDAFSAWIQHASPGAKWTIDNIQYYYESQRASDRPEENEDHIDETQDEQTENGVTHFEELGDEANIDETESYGKTREEAHGKAAIQIGQLVGALDHETEDCPFKQTNFDSVHRATEDDFASLKKWTEELQQTESTQQTEQVEQRTNKVNSSTGDVVPLLDAPSEVSLSSSTNRNPKPSQPKQNMIHPASYLNADQLRAYEILTSHLEERLAGRFPAPLRLIVSGEGGTGKSKFIDAVTTFFDDKNARKLLVKTAYTGIAASNIQGITCHTAAKISRSDKPMTNRTKQELQEFWKDVEYNLIDEFSMLGKSFFTKLSRNITIGKSAVAPANYEQSFGGISVALISDEHQFPPVACSSNEALYYPFAPQRDSLLQHIGRCLFEEFQTVVILKQQMRITDPTWQDFLYHLRHGQVQSNHLDLLRSLVLTNPNCSIPDFTTPPWNCAVLITPRHSVRTEWNRCALRRYCNRHQRQIFIVAAEHCISNKTLNSKEHIALQQRQQHTKSDHNELPDTLELAVGMPVLVTHNLCTMNDITNGARGTITDIVLHPTEPAVNSALPTVHLHRLPPYVLVKLERTRAPQFRDEERKTIPIFPIQKSLRISYVEHSKRVVKTVTRKQLPITAAYALTDYRAQGQTLPAVILDLAPPPTGKLNLFNAYVALSRSHGRHSIRLLRDFDEEAIKSQQLPQLADEDERLRKLNEETKGHMKTTQNQR